MKEETRLSPRIGFNHKVIVLGFGGSMKIMDFSTGGAFLRTENPSQFEREERIDIFTRLPLEKKAMVIKSRVVHIAKKGVGVKFLNLCGHVAEAIEYNFEVFKNTIPLATV
jgi:c-di-GMP-binding flagellar brake protein YcgR